MSTTERVDLYTRITNQIVRQLEQGVAPWQKPWRVDGEDRAIVPPLRATGQPYRGINVLLLWGEMVKRGYVAPTWMTYRQAAAVGGQVRKGERGTRIVYADRIVKTETDAGGNEQERAIGFLKSYTVFNVAQIDGLPEELYGAPTVRGADVSVGADDAVESFFARTRISIQHGGTSAFYSPSRDLIQLPPRECFVSLESYYSTLAHEAVHATAHPSRLDRHLKHRFGSDGYAMEELVAELGAAFLCAELGVSTQVHAEHASYLDHWLKVLNSDTRAIFTAAAHAQRAVDFLAGRSGCD